MRKILLWILVLISLLILLFRFGSKSAETFFGIKQKSGLRITTVPDNSSVFINGQQVSNTPYENSSLEPKEYTIKLQKDDNLWEGQVKLVSGTLTVVNRELSKTTASSAGEILTLDKGHGATVISNPSEAEIDIDGKYYGKTPLAVDIGQGEHTFTLSKDNYLRRSIRATLPQNYNLTISADLALSENDLSAPVPTPTVTATPTVVVLNTPTGFLRVRDKASLSGKEITQVKPGDELTLLDEQGSWDKVKLSDGTEGFVSSSYVKKKQ